MTDFTKLLDEVPSNANVYDFLSETVDRLVYPDLGRSFYIAAYASASICGLVIVTIAAGIYIRWRKNRLNFMVSDGPATRPNPRVVVPVLWLITAILLIVHTFWLRWCMKSRSMSFALGVYWWMMAGGLVCSYAVISLSVLCSAPALRKWLTRLNERRGSDRFAPSFLLVNGGLLAVCIIAICASYPAGRANGESFKYLHEAYTGAQALIARARTEQNLALMASFQAYVDLFDKSEERSRSGVYTGGIIYCTEIVFFFLTGLIPAVFLNLYLRRRIESLDNGLTSSILKQTLSSHNHHMNAFPVALPGDSPDQDVEILADSFQARFSRKIDLNVNKDRPFANLTPTSMLPINYASIFQAKVEPKEKAQRLRQALRRDNLQLLAFFLLLSSLFSLSLFEAAKGPFSFDLRKQLIIAHLWMHFSYDYCACLLAGFFLWDAIRNSNSEDVTIDLQVSSFAVIHNSNAPPVAAIQLSQTVEIVEEHPLQDKKSLYQVYSR